MSDLTARAIADLKAELAESKAAANRVTESMGSEIMRLTAELDAARQEAAELAGVIRDVSAELAGVIRDVSAMLAQAQEMLANG